MRTVLVTLIEFPMAVPPMGTAYINAVLHAQGYHCENLLEFVTVDDFAPSMVTAERARRVTFSDITPIVERIESYEPDVVGFSCVISNRKSTAQVASALKQRNPGLILIGGGPDIHPNPTMLYANGLLFHKDHMDYLVQGEGEEKIVALYAALETGEACTDIAGVYRCDAIGEGNILSGYSSRIEDLDALPFPDFGDNPRFDRFRDEQGFWEGIPIYFSRGCTRNCSYCGRYEYFKGYRWRSAENVFAEILHQVDRYGVDRFTIVDDDPLTRQSLPEIEKLAELLIGHTQPFYWEINNARHDKVVATKALPKLLHEAGLGRIQFGVESFSPSIRKHMGKAQTPEIVDTILQNFSEAGIKTGVFLIYGYPAETEADFAMTMQWLRDNAAMLSSLIVNCFYMTDWYATKRPGTFEMLGSEDVDGLAFWKSESVDSNVLRDRYREMKTFLEDDFDGFYYVADQQGNYAVGSPTRDMCKV
jgi:radical SAM superfamily enzyme YgiQ (UPF0313 family)